MTRWAGQRTRIIVESILLFLAVAFVAIWFYTPYVVRDYINRGLAGLPDYTGRVEGVRLHPLTASIDVYDFHIDKKGDSGSTSSIRRDGMCRCNGRRFSTAHSAPR